MPAYVHYTTLVSTQWLANHLDDPNIRIVEVILKIAKGLRLACLYGRAYSRRSGLG